MLIPDRDPDLEYFLCPDRDPGSRNMIHNPVPAYSERIRMGSGSETREFFLRPDPDPSPDPGIGTNSFGSVKL